MNEPLKTSQFKTAAGFTADDFISGIEKIAEDQYENVKIPRSVLESLFISSSVFNQMFELKQDINETYYIQAKLDLFGAMGIRARATTDALVPSMWDNLPTASTLVKGGVKVGDGLVMDGEFIKINGDIFNLTNYYTKTDSDGRYGRLAFANTWVENQVISKNLTVTGNLYVNGTEFIANTQTVQIEDNLAIINYGEVGAGITAGFAGWQIDRGSADDFLFGFTENPGFFQVGKTGAMQTVATREDVPTNNYYAKWNSTLKRFDTAIPAFSEIGSKPTTLSGYGITDGVTLNSVQTISAVKTFSANPVLSAASAILSFSSTTGFKTISTGGTTDLILMPGGKVGIGITVPLNLLDVYGVDLSGTIISARSRHVSISALTYNLNIKRNGIEYAPVYSGTSKTSSNLIISVDGTWIHADYGHIILLPKNNVGIGTETPTAGYKVDINGNLRTNGNIIATGSIGARVASDRDLKTRILPLSNPLTMVDRLNPFSFHWNEKAKELNPSYGDQVNYGVIAQELEEVMPELVYPIYHKYKGVDYIQMIPILIGAIKELKKEVEQLKKN